MHSTEIIFVLKTHTKFLKYIFVNPKAKFMVILIVSMNCKFYLYIFKSLLKSKYIFSACNFKSFAIFYKSRLKKRVCNIICHPSFLTESTST